MAYGALSAQSAIQFSTVFGYLPKRHIAKWVNLNCMRTRKRKISIVPCSIVSKMGKSEDVAAEEAHIIDIYTKIVITISLYSAIRRCDRALSLSPGTILFSMRV